MIATIGIRLSAEEKENLTVIAKRTDTTISQIVRKLIRTFINPNGIDHLSNTTLEHSYHGFAELVDICFYLLVLHYTEQQSLFLLQPPYHIHIQYSCDSQDYVLLRNTFPNCYSLDNMRRNHFEQLQCCHQQSKQMFLMHPFALSKIV